MDVSPRSRILNKLTTECLRLVRTTSKLTLEESEKLLEKLPSIIAGCLEALQNPNADNTIPEIPGYGGYSMWAKNYDNDPNNQVIIAEERHIWKLVGDVAAKRVRDVGAGTGRHTIPLARMGATVVAAEPNGELRRIAQSKASGVSSQVQWLASDIEGLPEDIGTFQIVLCCLVLSHVADIHFAISKLCQYLERGGIIIVTDFHPFNLLIGWRTSFLFEDRKYVVPNWVHLPSEYFQALSDAGVEVQEFKEVGEFTGLTDQPATIMMKGCKR